MVVTTAPLPSRSCARTCAAALSVNVSRAGGVEPSAFGVIVAGSFARSVNDSVTGGGGGGGVVEPSEPVAESAPGAAIVQECEPLAAGVEAHVQSTVGPWPEPFATVVPVPSVTVTVQGAAADRRAWKRTFAPSAPITVGA